METKQLLTILSIWFLVNLLLSGCVELTPSHRRDGGSDTDIDIDTDTDTDFDTYTDSDSDTETDTLDTESATDTQECNNGKKEGTEECDDGDLDPDNGCTPECNFTCTTNENCLDDNVCNGEETCKLDTHTCQPGEALVCTPANGCEQFVECDLKDGCVFETKDEDGDGSLCGTDCNDKDENVYPGAEESCNGIDDDCDTFTDEGKTTAFYPDCDGDTYAALDAEPTHACTKPISKPEICGSEPDADWITNSPDADEHDCYDFNELVFPGQTTYFKNAYSMPDPSGDGSEISSFDYDCSEQEDPEWGIFPMCSAACTELGWSLLDGPIVCGETRKFYYCVIDLIIPPGEYMCVRKINKASAVSCR